VKCSRCNHQNPSTGTPDGRCDGCGLTLAANLDSSNRLSASPFEQRSRAQPWDWRAGRSRVEVVTISTFSNAIEANLAKQELEAEGLTAFLDDEFITGFLWYWTVAVGWIKLRVPEPQVEQAISILLDSRISVQDLHEDGWKLSWADQTVERMFRVAVLGLMCLPLQLYSLWLLIRLLVSGRRVTPSQYWKLLVGLAFSTPTIVILLLVFFSR
jgi:Putative prokaryotic signal transducing protein